MKDFLIAACLGCWLVHIVYYARVELKKDKVDYRTIQTEFWLGIVSLTALILALTVPV